MGHALSPGLVGQHHAHAGHGFPVGARGRGLEGLVVGLARTSPALFCTWPYGSLFCLAYAYST